MSEPTTEKLAKAMINAGFGEHHLMVKRAREGYYDDFKSPLPTPMIQLVKDLQASGADWLAKMAIDGAFDATLEESSAWASSPEGQELLAELRGDANAATPPASVEVSDAT